MSPFFCFMSDTKRKISAWIPSALYDDIEKAGYTSPTIAVTKGLELLVKKQAGDIPETSRRQLGTERENLRNEIERLKASLQGAPNPVELAQLRARSEELERHNSTLKEELSKSGQREEDLKQMHNNYFLQVQTLINQKAIEAPGATKHWWRFW